MDEEIEYLGGRYVGRRAAWVSTADAGWRGGVGLVEALRVIAGEPRWLGLHLRRMAASARTLKLPAPPPESEVRQIVAGLVRRNARRDGRLRIAVTPGCGVGAAARPTVAIELRALPAGLPAMLQEGVAVCFARGVRARVGGMYAHKTLSRLESEVARAAARSRGCWEALFRLENGAVAEGCVSNLFAVRRGALLTPPVRDGNLLPGIARAQVLAAARHARVTAEEAWFDAAGFGQADEVFLTNSVRGIVPVLRVAGRRVGSGRVGAITIRLAEAIAGRLG